MDQPSMFRIVVELCLAPTLAYLFFSSLFHVFSLLPPPTPFRGVEGKGWCISYIHVWNLYSVAYFCKYCTYIALQNTTCFCGWCCWSNRGCFERWWLKHGKNIWTRRARCLYNTPIGNMLKPWWCFRCWTGWILTRFLSLTGRTYVWNDSWISSLCKDPIANCKGKWKFPVCLHRLFLFLVAAGFFVVVLLMDQFYF